MDNDSNSSFVANQVANIGSNKKKRNELKKISILHTQLQVNKFGYWYIWPQ